MSNAIAGKRQELECLAAANKQTDGAKEKISAKLEKTKNLLQETSVMTGNLAEKLQCDTYVGNFGVLS